MEDFEKDENKTDVERLVDELKETNVTFENYKSHVSKIQSSERIIASQIGNLIRNYKEDDAKLKEEQATDAYKRALDEGFVPKPLMDMSNRMNSLIKEAYSWKLLESQLYSIIFDKIFGVLDTAKALDIKREALKEMSEMDTKRNNMFLQSTINSNKLIEDIVNNKLVIMDEKFISTIKLIQSRYDNDIKNILSVFAESIAKSSEEKKELLLKLNKSVPHDSEDEKKIEEIIPPVKLEETKLEQDEEDPVILDDEDIDPFASDEKEESFEEPEEQLPTSFEEEKKEEKKEEKPTVDELKKNMEDRKDDNTTSI